MLAVKVRKGVYTKMNWTRSALVTPISVGIIENQKSYWANHFFSLFSALMRKKVLNILLAELMAILFGL